MAVRRLAEYGFGGDAPESVIRRGEVTGHLRSGCKHRISQKSPYKDYNVHKSIDSA